MERWEVVDDEPEEQEQQAQPDANEHDEWNPEEFYLGHWARFYRVAQRIRKLQGLWGIIGNYLQTIDPRLRRRLTEARPARS